MKNCRWAVHALPRGYNSSTGMYETFTSMYTAHAGGMAQKRHVVMCHSLATESVPMAQDLRALELTARRD